MTLIEELSNQFIPIVVLIAFGWYISHFAKAIIPRLLFICFGLYFAILGKTEFDHLIGLGFLLPHVKFFFEWIRDIFYGFKRGTLDIYYSFLTIYYKTRNVFIKAYRFFSGKKSRKQQKSTGNDYYQKQDHRDYEDFGQSSNNGQRKQQRQEQREQENYSQQDNDSNYEKSNQKKNNQDSFSSYQEEVIEDEISAEYKQFFSSSYYEVLGVIPDDDFDTIKKKFRKLQRQYHPDLNMDKSEFYTKISQNLNKAYEYFQKIHSV